MQSWHYVFIICFCAILWKSALYDRVYFPNTSKKIYSIADKIINKMINDTVSIVKGVAKHKDKNDQISEGL